MDTADEVAIHGLQIDLQCIKEELITTDSINQLDIADGLKELLISKNFTLNMLLDTPVSEISQILGIDNYIASVIRYAARRVVKDQYSGDKVSGKLNIKM
jgi:hypothetical protein